MSIPIRLRDIPLAQIDAEALVLTTAATPDLERLMISLQEVGLLNPPWLKPQPGRSRWQVVTGTRRVQAAARLGWPEITARLVPEDTADFSCLLVHLFDNAFTRGFNLKEQAALAARLLRYCDRQAVVSRYLPYLGLAPSGAHLERLLKMAGLEAPWQELAAQGRLALTAGALLAGWDPEDRAAAWPYLEALRLSQSKQEEFLEQVSLLARREGLAPAGVLAREEVARALNDPDRTPPERLAAVRQQLYRWVYPRLSAAREAFETALGRLGFKRHPRMRLQPPPTFEGPDFHLEIKFRDAPELQQLLAELTRLTHPPDFDDLTRL
ncbi:MAG: ParB/RepB/Spo0J family partition protein [Syntrophobacterales bacterium]|nr:ParB/RepB/Spo0J family partition protein [Syntrophobacterales bacterium]